MSRLLALLAPLALVAGTGCYVTPYHGHTRTTYRTVEAVRYQFSGQHPIPHSGGDWCLEEYAHYHDYAPETQHYVYTNNVYTYRGPRVVWYLDLHPIPAGGYCHLRGRHQHDYYPRRYSGWDYGWDRGRQVYVYKSPRGRHDASPAPSYNPPRPHSSSRPNSPPPNHGGSRPNRPPPGGEGHGSGGWGNPSPGGGGSYPPAPPPPPPGGNNGGGYGGGHPGGGNRPGNSGGGNNGGGWGNGGGNGGGNRPGNSGGGYGGGNSGGGGNRPGNSGGGNRPGNSGGGNSGGGWGNGGGNNSGGNSGGWNNGGGNSGNNRGRGGRGNSRGNSSPPPGSNKKSSNSGTVRW